MAIATAALTGAAGLLDAWRLGRTLRRGSRRRGGVLSVVVLGAPADVQRLLRRVEKTSGAACTVVGVVLDGAVAPGDTTRIWGEVEPALCYVGIEELGAAVRDLGADAVLVAGPLSAGNRSIPDAGPGAY